MLSASIHTRFSAAMLLLASLLIGVASLQAQPLHSVMLSVPDFSEEALNWCGPASAQIVMGGYPSSSCSVAQEDIWMSILSHKVETDWDTDPEGLRQALVELCPPTGTWSLRAKTTPEQLMGSVAYWMTRNNYPVPLLRDTVAHNGYTSHEERWLVIRGIVTDVDPTGPGVTSVELDMVCYYDPAPTTLGDPAIKTCEDGDIWNEDILQPVSKVGSSFFGKYVAIVEPPQKTIIARAAVEVLVGVLITPDDALKYAQRWIVERKFEEMDEYKLLKNARPLPPLLVNRDYGAYYIVPYSTDGKNVAISVLVNGYTGKFQSIAAYQPVSYTTQQQAIDTVIKYLGDKAKLGPQPEPPDAQLIYPRGERVASRFFPIWQVTAGRKEIGVAQSGKILTKMPEKNFFLKVPLSRPASLTWDGNILWTLDAASNKMHSIDKRSGAIVKTHTTQLKAPRGMAFDGRYLWVGDSETMKIHAIDKASGNTVRTIPIQVPPEKGFKAFEDLAWDGQYLWTAISAGFSSSYNKIDPATGRIVRSIFADCLPRGIEIHEGVLWSVCYNGDNLPAKIDQRNILDKDHETLRSRKFIGDIELKEASGLTFDGTYLWTMDRKLKRLFKIYAPPAVKN